MSLTESIQAALATAFTEVFGLEVEAAALPLQPTKKEFEGVYTFVTFPYAKQLRRSPLEVGQALGAAVQLSHGQLISGYNVVQGFLNLSLNDTVWLDLLADIVRNPDFGTQPANGRRVMVEYSSPNTNKPLHLGHLRNNFLGYSVAEILRANGYDVVRSSVINNRGVHICKSMLAYARVGQGETPESSGLKGDHLVGKYYVVFDREYKKQIDELRANGVDEETAKKEAPLMKEVQAMLIRWEQNDPDTVALWNRMNGWVYAGFDETYRQMGVSFDKTYYESDTYLLGKEIVEEGLAKGVFYRRPDGSVWIDLTPDGLDEKLVLRADGTSVYITQDLGTADLKNAEFGLEKSVYVVGNEQDYHFKVLFLILEKLGRSYAPGLYHLSYGMVDLPSGKMKSREGTVVDADELMQEMIDAAAATTQELGKIEGFSEAQAQALYRTLALGALKYFLLKVDPKKRMLFNPQESIEFQGNTGPFIQYTHARISSVLRKAEYPQPPEGGFSFREQGVLHPTERDLIVFLGQYPQRVRDAGEQYSPAPIAQYAYDLAKLYNQFYQEVSIFGAETETLKAFRLQLSAVVAQTIRRAMALLGVDVPERM
jgi:arginyl-tRNA synthetase